MDKNAIVTLVAGRMARIIIGGLAGVLAWAAGKEASAQIMGGVDAGWIQPAIEGALAFALTTLSFYWSHRKDGAAIQAAAQSRAEADSARQQAEALLTNAAGAERRHLNALDAIDYVTKAVKLFSDIDPEKAKALARMVATLSAGTEAGELIHCVVTEEGYSVQPSVPVAPPPPAPTTVNQ